MISRYPRWALFISGRGSNAQAVYDLMGQNQIQLCISSSSKALGILKAKRMGVSVYITKNIVPSGSEKNKELLYQKIHQLLLKHKITHVFLLGYMKILPPEFTELWKGRIYNLHPSVLPLYPGLHSIEKSYYENNRMGATVHRVISEMDAGDVIFQQEICKPHQAQNLDYKKRQLQISALEQKLVRHLFLKNIQMPLKLSNNKEIKKNKENNNCILKGENQ